MKAPKIQEKSEGNFAEVWYDSAYTKLAIIKVVPESISQFYVYPSYDVYMQLKNFIEEEIFVDRIQLSSIISSFKEI